MMRQVTVFCSRDLEPRVVDALDQAGVEGYLRVGAATGSRFLEKGRVPRAITWEAAMFVVPAAAEACVDEIVGRLEAYAGSCEIEPCLRIVVGPVERVH